MNTLRYARLAPVAAVYWPLTVLMVICYVTPLSVLSGRVRHWSEYALATVGLALWAALAVGFVWAL